MPHVLGIANQTHPKWGSFANYRGAGLAEMAEAIRAGKSHRCSVELALHTVEVMVAILQSAETGQSIPIASDCARPAALNDAAARDLMR